MKNKYSPLLLLALVFLLTVNSCATSNIIKTNPRLYEAQQTFETGKTFLEQGKLEEAEKYFIQTLTASEEEGFKPAIVLCLESLAFIEIKRGKLEKAIEKLDRAIVISQELENRVQTASLLNIKGKALSDRKEYTRALASYEESLEIARQTGSILGSAVTNNNIGKIYYLSGNRKKATEHYLKAMDMFLFLEDHKRAKVVLENIRLLESKEKSKERKKGKKQ